MEIAVAILSAGWLLTMIIFWFMYTRSQRFYMDQIQLLVNKAMSGTFTAYKRAEEPRVSLPAEPPEDLRSLQEFSLGV